MTDTKALDQDINSLYGLTKTYHHDFDNKTAKCKKCHTSLQQLIGGLKICHVIGKEEVVRFRDYEER